MPVNDLTVRSSAYSVLLAQVSPKESASKEKFKPLGEEEIKEKLKKDLGEDIFEKEPIKKAPDLSEKEKLKKDFFDYVSRRNIPLTMLRGGINLQIVEDHLKKGIDINEQDENGYTALMYAIVNSDKQLARFLLSKGAKTSFGISSGLRSGARSDEKDNIPAGDEKITSKNKSKPGDDVRERVRNINVSGWNSLMLASWYGKNDIIPTLIEFKADVNDKTQDGLTPLIIASRGIGYLGEKETEEHTSRRNESAWKKQFETASVLIEKGADIKAASIDGWTPLMHACFNNNVKLVKLLLEKEANINVQSNKGSNSIGPFIQAKTYGGWTPLICACYNNNPELINLLIKSGADINAQDGEGRTPLMYASSLGRAEIADILIKAGAKVNAKDKLDRTSLSFASMKGDINLISLLLNNRAEVNPERRTEAEGVKILTRSPLMFAILYDNSEAVKFLIDKGANVNDQDTRGDTPLHYACNKKFEDINLVTHLIQHKADVNLQDAGNRIALFDACNRGHKEIAHLLIKNGADFNTKAKDGTYPLDAALSGKSQAQWQKEKKRLEGYELIINMLKTVNAKSKRLKNE